MKFTKLLLACSLLFLACSKSKIPIRYKGEVIQQPNYCTSSTGFPFIIKYTNEFQKSDSVITINLPTQYKFIGQKIEFEMRDTTASDEKIICNGLFTVPRQVILLNVKPL